MSTFTEKQQATINRADLPFPNLSVRPQAPISPPVTPSPPATTTTNEPLSLRPQKPAPSASPPAIATYTQKGPSVTPRAPRAACASSAAMTKKWNCDRLDEQGRPLPNLRKQWERKQEEREHEAAAAAAAQDSLVPSPAVVVPTTPTRRFSTRVRDRRLRSMRSNGRR